VARRATGLTLRVQDIVDGTKCYHSVGKLVSEVPRKVAVGTTLHTCSIVSKRVRRHVFTCDYLLPTVFLW
jgi:hypothetical protein